MREGVLKANRDRLEGPSVGKGCIRYGRPQQIEPEVVRRLLADSAAATGPTF
jgi:hypothetical protein